MESAVAHMKRAKATPRPAIVTRPPALEAPITGAPMLVFTGTVPERVAEAVDPPVPLAVPEVVVELDLPPEPPVVLELPPVPVEVSLVAVVLVALVVEFWATATVARARITVDVNFILIVGGGCV